MASKLPPDPLVQIKAVVMPSVSRFVVNTPDGQEVNFPFVDHEDLPRAKDWAFKVANWINGGSK